MTEVGDPEKEHQIDPLVEPVPEIIEIPEPAHEPARVLPVPNPVPVAPRQFNLVSSESTPISKA